MTTPDLDEPSTACLIRTGHVPGYVECTTVVDSELLTHVATGWKARLEQCETVKDLLCVAGYVRGYVVTEIVTSQSYHRLIGCEPLHLGRVLGRRVAEIHRTGPPWTHVSISGAAQPRRPDTRISSPSALGSMRHAVVVVGCE